MTITQTTYKALERAYEYFNEKLFDDELPECLITLAHQRSAYGYFRNQAFEKRKSLKKKPTYVHEIALNPFTFKPRTQREILSTLVHEMTHLWQHVHGEPKKTHHDRQWADKMEEIGLMPSSTGQPGGKRTGRRVSHYIIDGGPFDKAEKGCKVKIDWDGHLIKKNLKKGSNRTKYTCPSCDLNAYGKAGIHIVCGECEEVMEEQ